MTALPTEPAPSPPRPSTMASSSSRSARPDRSARELRGTLAKVLFRNAENNFTIAKLSRPAEHAGEGVKGIFREPAINLEYHFLGRWQSDPRYGWSFAFDYARPLLPTSASGIADYLRARCRWIGAATARAIVAAYGEATLATLKADPERVAREVRGLTSDRAAEIAATLRELEALEAVEVDVRGLVGPAGVNARQINAIIDRYGKQAADVVRANSYRMIEEVEGIGWATADQVAAAIGGAGGDRRGKPRIRAAIMHALAEAADDGHTCQPRPGLVATVLEVLGFATDQASRALVEDVVEDVIEGVELASYVPVGPPGVEMFALIARRRLFEAERAIVTAVIGLLEPAVEPSESSERDPLDDVFDAIGGQES